MPRVEVEGVGIHYEVSGEGRPVVLLHGFPDTGRLWRHQVPVLAESGFKVIVPDLRGYGRSDKPESVEAYALDRTDLDLYGMHAAIDFGTRLRGTLRFDSVDALVEQMHRDVDQARELTA